MSSNGKRERSPARAPVDASPAEPSAAPRPTMEHVVDVRSIDAYTARRYKHAVHIPASQLKDRLFELPAKDVPLAVIVDDSCIDEAKAVMAEAKWKSVSFMTQPPVPSDEALPLTTSDPTACTVCGDFDSGPVHQRLRLWSPGAFVTRCLPLIEEHLGNNHLASSAEQHAASPGEPQSSTTVLPGAGLTAVDVGCGCGRDCAYLASRGWAVVGYDNRTKLLRQAREVGHRFPVAVAANARNEASAANDNEGKSAAPSPCVPFAPLGFTEGVMAALGLTMPLRPRSADLIVIVRFLHRPLLPRLLSYLRPGGFLLYSHFVDGVQLVGTPKHERAYLKKKELTAIAEAAGATILIDEENKLADGRPVVDFLCQVPLE